MFGILLYAGVLLLGLIAVNVLIVRTIRGERQREADERTRKPRR